MKYDDFSFFKNHPAKVGPHYMKHIQQRNRNRLEICFSKNELKDVYILNFLPWAD